MKKILIITLVFCVGFQVLAQKADPKTNIHQLIQKETDSIYDTLVKIRRDLHMHPEVSEHEERTAGIIESYLRSLGLETKAHIGGNGVVGILKGNKEGRHIAWRADIDAVPSDIPDVVEFKSKNPGVRHICGHDVHTSIGLGIANVLSKHKDKISGTIYFIFQPAEEILNKGAETMIEDGLFEIINPSEIYGLHITPIPVGLITTKENELYSYFRDLIIKYNNFSNEDTVVRYTRNLLERYNTVDNRFWDNRNIGNQKIGVSSPHSIYKSYLAVSMPSHIKNEDESVEISIRISGTNKKEIDSLIIKVENEIKQSKFSKHLQSVAYEKLHPTVNNDPTLTRALINSITATYGNHVVIPDYGVINTFNDDFSYFQQKVPGVYTLLGGSNFEKGIISMPHAPNFAVDEEAISVGVKYFSSMLYERVNIERNEHSQP